MCTMYNDASNNNPSYTDISSYVVWKVHSRAYLSFILV